MHKGEGKIWDYDVVVTLLVEDKERTQFFGCVWDTWQDSIFAGKFFKAGAPGESANFISFL